ncbi:MAG: hypothetical protein AVDCRST_MAG59-1940 [uncultured Thermomicrobiales bacterium]|uniref:Uncharacterized protein n=1 Tax=uncultured Thermomicrobiales bacterium TaxID=1645740 RepID=A0A6J4UM73_9BACT|nr:MAG: hypothetical protein AVDCRST_MAG59-1940 [uncultured Thermomicrobiales bacterium]
MKSFWNRWTRAHGAGGAGTRFSRYYGDVARAGVGYPTADEARRDMVRHDRVVNRYSWVR